MALPNSYADLMQTSTNGNQMTDLSSAPIVVNSAYTTSASARPQKLSNGWLVSVVNNTTNSRIDFYVSKDAGVNWSQLCFYGINPTGGFSVASKGTIVYILAETSGQTSNHFQYFDATTVANADIGGSGYTDSSQTAFGACSLTIDPTQTYLHASWSSKNATYPNSSNIRCAKGTINGDGSVTWGSVTQVTSQNSAGNDFTQPCITVYNGYPIIVYQFVSSSNYFIYVSTNPGAGFTAHTVYSGGTYSQSSPDAIVDQNGVLWVVWNGGDASNPTNNLRCSKSTDSEVTWIKPSDGTVGHDKLTNENNAQAYSSITYDNDNNVTILFQGIDTVINASYIQIRKIVYSVSWSAITSLTNNAANSNVNPSTCNNAQDSFRYIYKDAQASSVRFDANPRPKRIISNIITPPEMYIPLWWYSGSISSGTNTSSSASYLLAKGSTSLTASTNSQTKLHTLNSTWSTSIKYAIEAAIYNGTSSDITYMALWDITAGSIVSSSQTSITSTTATVTRSAQFTLTPGHIYGVALWCNAGTAYITDVSLIVFPS